MNHNCRRSERRIDTKLFSTACLSNHNFRDCCDRTVEEVIYNETETLSEQREDMFGIYDSTDICDLSGFFDRKQAG